MKRSMGSALIMTVIGLGLVFSYQNCGKSFETLEVSSLSSKSSECPRDFVIDIQGNCLSPSQATSACQINGQLVADGSTIRTFQTDTVPAGSQCLAEDRSCSGGLLSGNFTALSCTVQAAPPPPVLKSCSFNGILVQSGKSVTAYAAGSAQTCQKEERLCTDGVLSGSYMFSTCIPQGAATCSAADLIVAQRSLIQSIEMTMNEVTSICADGAIPDPKLNLPGLSAVHALRFVNTCGNRACVAKGFSSGRAVEYNSTKVILECRTNTIPTNITTACQQRLGAMPKFTENVNFTDAQLSSFCPNTADMADMSPEQLHIRKAFTCASKSCRAIGYTGGKISEVGAGNVTAECTREANFNQLNLGTFATILYPSIQAIAQTCVNADNPDVNNLLPSVNGNTAVIFHNTCGRRYCLLQGYQSGGRVLEVTNNTAMVLCIRQQ